MELSTLGITALVYFSVIALLVLLGAVLIGAGKLQKHEAALWCHASAIWLVVLWIAAVYACGWVWVKLRQYIRNADVFKNLPKRSS